MDIIRKEKEILEKLRDSGYSRFRGDKNAALDYLAEQMEKIMHMTEMRSGSRSEAGSRGMWPRRRNPRRMSWRLKGSYPG